MNEIAWRELRHQVIVRDRRTCQYCGGTGHQVDFVIPAIHGGQASMDNLVCSCGLCLKAAGLRLFPSRTAKASYIASHRGKSPSPIPWWAIAPKPLPTRPKPNTTSRLKTRLKTKRLREIRHDLDNA